MAAMSPEDFPNRAEDEALRAALHRVHIPANLPHRIKQAVESERKAAVLVETFTAVQPLDLAGELSSGLARRRTLNRRWFLTAATAASMAGIGAAIHYSTRPLEPSWLAQECLGTLRRIESDSGGWQPVSSDYQQEIFRARPLLRPVRWIGVRKLPLESPIVAASAFRLDAGDGRALILFHLDLSRELVGLTSRLLPLQSASGDWAIAAMCERKRVIALAVAGTNSDLLNYIHISREA